MAKGDKAMPMPASKDEHVSISVRKIDNGYVARHSHSSPQGYTEREVYHATKPKIAMPAAPAAKKPAAPKKPAKRGYR